ncbi:hypothetical protein QBC41DRAFT_393570 [Cercophora samala]|uniref:Uncharacterized protein n=1 Tax=Cercophora samala TaxID=330535 RepID=A0AA39ZCQ6_9PEZI|nr:hypothetical protein QBC41DRAFT_393570 [Cercophora samala]
MASKYHSVTTTTDIRERNMERKEGEERPRKFPWSGIAWRFMSSLFCFAAIIVMLWGFERMGFLDSWERRGFNTLSILLSAFVSLALGSLLTLLGNMLRWLLLHREESSPGDVDLILGIGAPTGSLKLLWNHTSRRKGWTKTTVIVLLYFIVAILARLSIAGLGLTFELGEEDGIDYPVMITDWGNEGWVAEPDHVQTMQRFIDFALVGLVASPISFNKSDPTSWTTQSVDGLNINRTVDGGTLTYTLSLNEYRGLEVESNKDHLVHSSSSCIARNFYNGTVYRDGKNVGTVSEQGVPRTAPEHLQMLAVLFAYYSSAFIDYIWSAGIDERTIGRNSTGCMTTYLYNEEYLSFLSKFERNATYFECTSCLSTSSGPSEPRSGLSPSLFSERIPPSNTSFATDMLLGMGTLERRSQYKDTAGLFTRQYSAMNTYAHFVNLVGDGTPRRRARSGMPDWYLRPVPVEEEVWVAHLAARLPILGLIGAQRELPRVTKEQGASEKPFVPTALQVK